MRTGAPSDTVVALSDSQSPLVTRVCQLAEIKDHVYLSPVSWTQYEAILEGLAHRRRRHTYDRGRFEIMSRSPLVEPLRASASECRQLAGLVAGVMEEASHLYLSLLSWPEYIAILDELEKTRRLRHTYDKGSIEIMTRSVDHEKWKDLLMLLVVILFEECRIEFETIGECTLTSEGLDKGLEPDQCFWVANAEWIRTKRGLLDLTVDPPPDLFIEIEKSRSLILRLPILAALGIGEVWRFKGKTIKVGLLNEQKEYVWGNTSPIFPGIDLGEVARFVVEGYEKGKLQVLSEFRAWARKQVTKKPARKKKQ